MRLIGLDEFLRQNCVDRMEGKSCEECKHHVLEVSCERLMEQPTIDQVKWIPCKERLPKRGVSVLISHVGYVSEDYLDVDDGALFFWNSGIDLEE